MTGVPEPLDTAELRASFVQYTPVVVISKDLALQLLNEIERLLTWKAEVMEWFDWYFGASSSTYRADGRPAPKLPEALS